MPHLIIIVRTVCRMAYELIACCDEYSKICKFLIRFNPHSIIMHVDIQTISYILDNTSLNHYWEGTFLHLYT